jgi:hypothetical protein
MQLTKLKYQVVDYLLAISWIVMLLQHVLASGLVNGMHHATPDL